MSDIQKKKEAETSLAELNEMIANLESKKDDLMTLSLEKEEELKSKLIYLSVEIDNRNLILDKLDSEIKEKKEIINELYITYKSLVDENNSEREDLKEREEKIAKKEKELQIKELDINNIILNNLDNNNKLIEREKNISFKEKDLQNKESSLKSKEDNLFERENKIIIEKGILEDKEKKYYKVSGELDKREELIRLGENNLKNAEEEFRITKLKSLNLADQNRQDMAIQKEQKLDIESRERKIKLEQENIERIKVEWAKKESNLILREEEVRFREKQVAIKEKTIQ